MNAWEILGIEPTKDKKEIKKAYARLLKQYHPEENPEEFKQIQAAYQQCLHPNQEIESVSYEQNIESKQDIQTQSISLVMHRNEVLDIFGIKSFLQKKFTAIGNTERIPKHVGRFVHEWIFFRDTEIIELLSVKRV